MPYRSGAQGMIGKSGRGKTLVFISYSSAQKDIADELHKHLERCGISAFFSEVDIPPGAAWRSNIRENMDECEYFVMILTGDYRRSLFADQEFGMAHMGKKEMRIIKFDEMMPYGFMEEYQHIKKEDVETDNKIDMCKLIEMIFSYDKDYIINYYISALENPRGSFDSVRFYNKKLETLNPDLTKEQINQIAKAYVSNCQLHQAVGIDYIVSLISDSESKIDEKYCEKLKVGFVCNKQFKSHKVESIIKMSAAEIMSRYEEADLGLLGY